MRAKLVTAVAVLVATFLLVTNPVVAQAAKLVSGKDIKNNSVTTKDIKNGSLLSADFKAGQIPTGPTGPAGALGPSGVVKIAPINSPISGLATNDAAFQFAGAPVSVTIAAGQAVFLSASMSLKAAAVLAQPIAVATCYKPAVGGSVTKLNEYVTDNVSNTTYSVVAVSGYGALAAGTYLVGPCLSTAFNAFPADLNTSDRSVGWVAVVKAG